MQLLHAEWNTDAYSTICIATFLAAFGVGGFHMFSMRKESRQFCGRFQTREMWTRPTCAKPVLRKMLFDATDCSPLQPEINRAWPCDGNMLPSYMKYIEI